MLLNVLPRWIQTLGRRRPGKSSRRRLSGTQLLEMLESRWLLSTIHVTTTADILDAEDGETSFREAILAANSSAGTDTIAFELPVNDGRHLYYLDDSIAGQVTLDRTAVTSALSDDQIGDIDPDYAHSWWSIQLASNLPVITDSVVIDGFSQGAGTVLAAMANTAGPLETINSVLRVEIQGTRVATNSTFSNGSLSSGGITISGGDSTVRGLAINRIPNGAGIELITRDVTNPDGTSQQVGHHNRVQGNFIGTDISGTLQTLAFDDQVDFSRPTTNAANGTTSLGVHVWHGSSFNVIGTDGDGTDDNAERNLISGNWTGIALRGLSSSPLPVYAGSAAHHNTIAGNFVGTDRTGLMAVPNWLGINTLTEVHDNVIGVSSSNRSTADHPGAATEGNLISGNFVGIAALSTGTPIAEKDGLYAGNRIGPDRTGTAALSGRAKFGASATRAFTGNFLVGIGVTRASTNIQIGGPRDSDSPASLANIIAYNSGPGVWVFDFRGAGTAGIRIQGNSIHDNAGLGIDLGGDYPTPIGNGVNVNDPGDADTGPNSVQNFPVITAAAFLPNSAVLSGSLRSHPKTAYTIEVFANPEVDSSGYGEGKYFLGAFDVVTDDSGRVTFTDQALTFPEITGEVIQFLSATATVKELAIGDMANVIGNTSEFSEAFVIPPTIGNAGVGGTLTWDAGGDGVSWQDARNWSNDLLPGATDDVVIDFGDNSFTVSLTGVATVRSVTSHARISVAATSAQLNVSESSTFASLSLTGNASRLGGTGSVLVTGDMTWTNSKLVGSGTVTVNGSLTFGNNTLSGRSLVTNGTSHFSSGSLFDFDQGATWTNHGSVRLGEGVQNVEFRGPAGTSFVNASDGTVTSVNRTNKFSLPFANQGLVDVEAGFLRVLVSGIHSGWFLANGDLQLVGATLTETSKLSGRGQFTLQDFVSSATVEVAQSTADSSGGEVVFYGQNELTGNVVSLGSRLVLEAARDGDLTIPVRLDMGTRPLDLEQITIIGRHRNISDQLIDVELIAGDIRMDDLNMDSSGGAKIQIAGTGAFEVMKSSIRRANEPGNEVVFSNRSLVFAQTAISDWSSGVLVLDGTSSIRNEGDWTISGNSQIVGSSPTATFINSGTLTVASGSLNCNVPFSNPGTVISMSSSRFLGGGESSGVFETQSPVGSLDLRNARLTEMSMLRGAGEAVLGDVESSGTVNLTGDVYFFGRSRLTGNVVSVGAQVTLDSFFRPAVFVDLGTFTLNLKALTIRASHSNTLSGELDAELISGDITTEELLVSMTMGSSTAGVSQTRIGGSGRLEVSRQFYMTANEPFDEWILSERELVLSSTAVGTWGSGALVLDSTSSIRNEGNWTISGNSRIVGSSPTAAFINTGTLAVGGQLIVAENVPVTNAAGAKFEISQGGYAAFTGGGLDHGTYVVDGEVGFNNVALSAASKVSGMGQISWFHVTTQGLVQVDAPGELILVSETSFGATSRLTGTGRVTVKGETVFAGSYELTGLTSGPGRIEFATTDLDHPASIQFGTLTANSMPRFNVGSLDFGNVELQLSLAAGLALNEQTTFRLINSTQPLEGTPQIDVGPPKSKSSATGRSLVAIRESVPFTLNGTQFLMTFEGGDGNDLVLVPLNEATIDLGTVAPPAADRTSGPVTVGGGTVNGASDKDLFRFRSPDASLESDQRFEITVDLRRTSGSMLDPHLRVFHLLPSGEWRRVAFDDDSGADRNAQARFFAEGDKEFIVVAGGFASSFGGYELRISAAGPVLDDFPNVFNSASDLGRIGPTPISVTETEAVFAIQPGQIEVVGDVDFVEITAGYSGLIRITQSTASPDSTTSPLRHIVFVFDSRQRLLGFSDGDNSTSVQINVRANDRLIIRSALGNDANGQERTGQYNLTFANPNRNDDLPNDFRGARDALLGSAAVTISPSVQTTVSGNIEVFADRDLVSFVSQITGRVTARLRAAAESLLDPALTVFDSLRQVIVANDDLSAGNRNSFVTFDVSTGSRYYVQAAGFGIDPFNRPAGQTQPTGRYLLELNVEQPDDAPDVLSAAAPLALDSNGTGRVDKSLQWDADKDVFEIVAMAAADITLTLTAQTGSFTGLLEVLDNRQVQIARVEAIRQTVPLQATVTNVIAGQRLFVRVSGSAATSVGPQGEVNVQYGIAVATAAPSTETVLLDEKTGRELERALVDGLARALEDFAALDDVAGLGEVLESSPGVTIHAPPDIVLHRGRNVANDTNRSIVASFLSTQGGQANLTKPVFLIWIDPISPQVSAVTSTNVIRVGHTLADGTVNEARGNSYYSGDGVTQLLILSAAETRTLTVQLIGLGGAFRVGINYLTRETTSTITIQDSLYKDAVSLVYDFANANPTRTPPPPTSNPSQPIPNLPSLSNSFTQAGNDSSFLAFVSATLLAIRNAATRVNTAESESNGNSSGDASVSAASDSNAIENNDDNADYTISTNAAREALNALIKFLNSNGAGLMDFSRIPGGEVLQDVVNFIRQWFSQSTPPTSDTKAFLPKHPAKSDQSSVPSHSSIAFDASRKFKVQLRIKLAGNNQQMTSAASRSINIRSSVQTGPQVVMNVRSRDDHPRQPTIPSGVSF